MRLCIACVVAAIAQEKPDAMKAEASGSLFREHVEEYRHTWRQELHFCGGQLRFLIASFPMYARSTSGISIEPSARW